MARRVSALMAAHGNGSGCGVGVGLRARAIAGGSDDGGTQGSASVNSAFRCHGICTFNSVIKDRLHSEATRTWQQATNVLCCFDAASRWPHSRCVDIKAPAQA